MVRTRLSLDGIEQTLGRLEQAGLLRSLRVIEGREGAEILVGGQRVVDFSSNDYLGLASHPDVTAAVIDSLQCVGVGAAASRSISGNHVLHEAVERELAALKGVDAALLFSSGYAANVGALPALTGRRDVIYSDALNHASIIDGCRLSRAETRVFPHGDLVTLERLLIEDQGKYDGRLVVVEGVYSMDGDVFPLRELVSLCDRHQALSYVDDAHGTAVLGRDGSGSADRCGVHGMVHVTVGTLGKALGVSGAFVAGSEDLRRFLLNRARSFIFTTGTPPALAAGVTAALEVARREEWRRDALWANAKYLSEGLREIGVPLPTDIPGHILPLVIGDSKRTSAIAKQLLAAGYLVGAIRPPTVPRGTARLRITVSAVHTDADLEGLLLALSRILPRVSRTPRKQEAR